MTLACALLLAGWALAAPASAERALYTVPDIAVDVTAEDAVAARAQALEQGQREGLERLLERFTAPEERGRLPNVAGLSMDRFVRSIEIDDEELAPDRYIANLTVSYNPAAVRELLEGAEVAYGMDPSPPQLVLPLYETPEAQILWEDPNPWREAWSEHMPRHSLVRLVLPLGDLRDITTLDASRAFRGDAEAARDMAERYDAEQVLVVRATPARVEAADADAHAVRIDVIRIGRDREVVHEESLRGQPGQELPELLALGVERVARALEREWQRGRLLRHDIADSLLVEVALAELDDWVHIENILRRMPEIRSTSVDAFARDVARLRVEYVGGRDRLEEALARHGLRLLREGETWRLQRTTGLPGREADPSAAAPPS